MNDLSEKQKQLLIYLRNKVVHTGVPPTIAEIIRDCHINGIGSAVHHLKRLEKFGYIKREKGFRNIRVLRDITVDDVQLPLVGAIKAGSPNIANEEIECYLNAPKTIAKNDKDYFLLRVKGDSMVNAGIVDGDIVVIQKTQAVQDGDIVAAVIGNDATLKRLRKAHGGLILQPENDKYLPIVIKDLSDIFINGKVVGKIVSEVITDL